jgi:excisionase family DNA binding protein
MSVEEVVLLDADEVARMLRVDRKRVYALVAERLLPAVRLGRRQLRIKRAEVLAFIERSSTAPGAAAVVPLKRHG